MKDPFIKKKKKDKLTWSTPTTACISNEPTHAKLQSTTWPRGHEQKCSNFNETIMLTILQILKNVKEGLERTKGEITEDDLVHSKEKRKKVHKTFFVILTTTFVPVSRRIMSVCPFHQLSPRNGTTLPCSKHVLGSDERAESSPNTTKLHDYGTLNSNQP